jgi:deoxycytidine triphosphate deaminase
MILGEDTILRREIIQRSKPGNFRSGSYDLVVRDIVSPDGKVVSEFILPPQGVVKVISEEIIKVPDDVIGYVLVKTSLCNEGVLALNIGIVDPEFFGPLQSTLINFGKSNFLIEAGDVFSRISFHALEDGNGAKPVELTYDKVKKNVRDDALKYLGTTFLDIEKTSEKAAEKAFGSYKTSMLIAVPLIAILIAALTFCLNFANIWAVHSRLKPEEVAKDEITTDKVDLRLKQLEAQNAELSRKLDAVVASHRAGSK